MGDRNIAELLKRTLVIVAHPDDEAIGAGGLMQRIRDAGLVFCTDGGPLDPYFWKACGSRENYAKTRRHEAERAANLAGVKRLAFLPIIDQELYKNLRPALNELETLIGNFRPHAILSMAYEGGHPDHDSCAFLSHILGARHDLPVWEMPLYFRKTDGARCQEFVFGEEGLRLHIEPRELENKREMVRTYASQALILDAFNLEVERFRPQAAYDFTKPPPAEVINYEAWQWPIKATEVSAAFSQMWSEVGASRRQSFAG